MHKEFQQLKERKKELECLYEINELLKNQSLELDDVLKKIIRAIPDGYQYPGICMVRLNFENEVYTTPNFYKTSYYQRSQIIVDHNYMGLLEVFYTESIEKMKEDKHSFLPEEQQLLNTIAEQIGLFVFNRRLKNTMSYLKEKKSVSAKQKVLPVTSDEHWKWRMMMAEKIVNKLDFNEYGVKAVYLIGSTKEATAGPSSDLDLLFYVRSRENFPYKRLWEWLQGWSCALTEINYEKTGYYVKDGLIDAHFIVDEDFKNNDSFASMIGHHTNSARLLKQNK